MSTLNIVRRCYGCGAILQSEDKEKEGYIDKSFLESSLDTVLFCEKCWNETSHNRGSKPLTASEDFLHMLRDAAASDALIVYVLDLFSFETLFVPEINDIIRNSPILIIANKRDLMPKEAKDEALKEYVAHRCRVASLNVTADDVILTTLSNPKGDQDWQKVIDEKRRAHDVYVIGSQKAGKTIFLQSFLRHYKNKSRRNISIHNYPGTMLSLLEIPLDASSSIYDTPGTSTANTVISKVETETGAAIYPDSQIERRKENLGAGDSLLLGGVARIDLLETKDKGKTAVSIYASSEVKVKKCQTKKAEEEFIDGIRKGNLTPVSKLLQEPKDFDVYEVAIDETDRRDIGIGGLGWISFQSEGQKFNVYVPSGTAIYVSRSKVS